MSPSAQYAISTLYFLFRCSLLFMMRLRTEHAQRQEIRLVRVALSTTRQINSQNEDIRHGTTV